MIKMVAFVFLTCLMAVAQQPPRSPDVNAQRLAMKKLAFLLGDWVGSGRKLRTATEWVEFGQTEHVEYKLDGLLLVIEGEGRAKGSDQQALQAYGLVSYNDAAGKYHMRAFNDGRWLETDVVLGENGKELTWGFTLGEMRTKSVLRLTEAGEWIENHEITIGTQPPKKFMEIAVKPVRPK